MSKISPGASSSHPTTSPISPSSRWATGDIDVYDGESLELLSWVNKHLHHFAFLSSANHIELESLAELDAKQLGRIVDHILQQLEAAEVWECLCHHRNPGNSARCQKCTRIRAYIGPWKRRQISFRVGGSSGGSGSGGDSSSGGGALLTRKVSYLAKAREAAAAAPGGGGGDALLKKLKELDRRQQPVAMAALPAALDGEVALLRAAGGKEPQLTRALLCFLQEVDEAVAEAGRRGSGATAAPSPSHSSAATGAATAFPFRGRNPMLAVVGAHSGSNSQRLSPAAAAAVAAVERSGGAGSGRGGGDKGGGSSFGGKHLRTATDAFSGPPSPASVASSDEGRDMRRLSAARRALSGGVTRLQERVALRRSLSPPVSDSYGSGNCGSTRGGDGGSDCGRTVGNEATTVLMDPEATVSSTAEQRPASVAQLSWRTPPSAGDGRNIDSDRRGNGSGSGGGGRSIGGGGGGQSCSGSGSPAITFPDTPPTPPGPASASPVRASALGSAWRNNNLVGQNDNSRSQGPPLSGNGRPLPDNSAGSGGSAGSQRGRLMHNRSGLSGVFRAATTSPVGAPPVGGGESSSASPLPRKNSFRAARDLWQRRERRGTDGGVPTSPRSAASGVGGPVSPRFRSGGDGSNVAPMSPRSVVGGGDGNSGPAGSGCAQSAWAGPPSPPASVKGIRALWEERPEALGPAAAANPPPRNNRSDSASSNGTGGGGTAESLPRAAAEGELARALVPLGGPAAAEHDKYSAAARAVLPVAAAEPAGMAAPAGAVSAAAKEMPAAPAPATVVEAAAPFTVVERAAPATVVKMKTSALAAAAAVEESSAKEASAVAAPLEAAAAPSEPPPPPPPPPFLAASSPRVTEASTGGPLRPHPVAVPPPLLRASFAGGVAAGGLRGSCSAALGSPLQGFGGTPRHDDDSLPVVAAAAESCRGNGGDSCSGCSDSGGNGGESGNGMGYGSGGRGGTRGSGRNSGNRDGGGGDGGGDGGTRFEAVEAVVLLQHEEASLVAVEAAAVVRSDAAVVVDSSSGESYHQSKQPPVAGTEEEAPHRRKLSRDDIFAFGILGPVSVAAEDSERLRDFAVPSPPRPAPGDAPQRRRQLSNLTPPTAPLNSLAVSPSVPPSLPAPITPVTPVAVAAPAGDSDGGGIASVAPMPNFMWSRNTPPVREAGGAGRTRSFLKSVENLLFAAEGSGGGSSSAIASADGRCSVAGSSGNGSGNSGGGGIGDNVRRRPGVGELLPSPAEVLDVGGWVGRRSRSLEPRAAAAADAAAAASHAAELATTPPLPRRNIVRQEWQRSFGGAGGTIHERGRVDGGGSQPGGPLASGAAAAAAGLASIGAAIFRVGRAEPVLSPTNAGTAATASAARGTPTHEAAAAPIVVKTAAKAPGLRRAPAPAVPIPQNPAEAVAVVAPGILAMAVGAAGCFRTAAAALAVCHGWRRALRQQPLPLLLELVYTQGIPAAKRPRCWRQLATAAAAAGALTTPTVVELKARGGVTTATFASLVAAGEDGPFSFAIGRDVPRAFGTAAPHRRAATMAASASLPVTPTSTGAAVADPSGGCAGHAAEGDWAAIPVDAKRRCLSNVLHAAAATFEDLGYAQGMDRLAEMVMRCFASELFGHFDKRAAVDGLDPLAAAVPSAMGADAKAGASTRKAAGAGAANKPAVAAVTAAVTGGFDNPAAVTTGAAATTAALPGRVAFEVFAGLLGHLRVRELFLPERGGLLICTGVLQALVETRLPRLARHMARIEVTLDMVAMGWFQCLFLHVHAMPRPTLARLWDCWLVSGDLEVFFRAALAILALAEPSLLRLDFDELLGYLATFPEPSLLVPSMLLPAAQAVRLSDGELMYLEQRVRRAEGFELSSVTELLLRPGRGMMSAQ